MHVYRTQGRVTPKLPFESPVVGESNESNRGIVAFR